MINDDRAAQIFVDDVGSGSGYAVTAQLILTARHVLHREGSPPPAMGSAVEVRLWGDLRNHDRFWRHGTVYWWDPDRDVALLRLADGEIDRSPTLKDLKENGCAAATIGELPADGDFDDCRAFGWPRVMNRGEERPPMPFRGTAIARGRRAEDPIFAIATDLTPNEETGWKGMSGAAFRINQTIVGIVIEADDRFKEDPLAALPLAPIALQSAFWQAVGVSTIRKLRGKSPRGLPPPYVQAPALYVPRPELTEPILTFLHQHHSTKKADIAVIAGMGGLGKSTVARWIASTPRMRQVFADGQVWVTLGTEHADALIMLTGWINAIRAADEPEIHLPTHEAAKAELERRLCDRAVLFVIDDIWPKNSEVAANLLSNASRCGYLITTRFADVFQSLSDATKKQVTKGRSLQVFDIGSMSEEQGINLLERHLKRPLSQGERSAAHDLIATVGGHPRSLELTAGRIDGESLTKLSRDLSGEFVRLEQIEKKQRGLGRAPNLSAEEQKRKSTRISLLFSINDLNEKGRTLFATLGVLAKDSIITSPAAATLWSTDVDQAADFLRDLSGRHLLRPAPRAALTDGFRLHHLLHDLARELLAVAANPAWLTRSLTELPPQVEGQISAAIADGSQKLLERYRAKTQGGLWHTLADDNYIYDHLVEHFETAGWKEEIEKLLWEETADGRCGWYAARERLGQTEGFLADVRGIWDYADRALASAKGETL
ncbi:MAG: NB-ARC domain-containing protein, partial [Nitrospira sp.]